jgi:hypothetical protein
VSGLQFVAWIVSTLAWPIAAVVMAALPREALVNAIERMRSPEFPGGRVSFDKLPVYEKMAEAASKEAEPPTLDDAAIIRHEAAEFSVVEALASVAPRQAVIDAWGLHSPAVVELRRLRDYTVQSGRPPSTADAARYVSVAQDGATTLQTAFPPSERGGGDEGGDE